MFATRVIIVKPNDSLYSYFQENAKLAKLLWNACLYRLRNVEFAVNKGFQNLNPQQIEVIDELNTYRPVNKKALSMRNKIVNYVWLDRVLKLTKNSDYNSGLSKHAVQRIIKTAVKSIKSYHEALKEYYKDPSKFLGKPQLPYYCQSDMKTYEFSNQVTYIMDRYLKLPGTKLKLDIGEDLKGKYLHTTIRPYYDCFKVCVVCDVEYVRDTKYDQSRIIGLDPGVNNFLAVSNNCGLTPFIINGRVIKSKNRYYRDEISRLQSCLEKCQGEDSSKRIRKLWKKRDCYFRDKWHQISCYLVKYCRENNIGVIVYGKNQLWKQKCNMGHKNNHEFGLIPHARFFEILKDHCYKEGIEVIETEESYTSKASFLDNDFIPVFGQPLCNWKPSGRRPKRGFYKSSNGTMINADINGASNIIRKAIEIAFDNVNDFSYLLETVEKVTI